MTKAKGAAKAAAKAAAEAEAEAEAQAKAADDATGYKYIFQYGHIGHHVDSGTYRAEFDRIRRMVRARRQDAIVVALPNQTSAQDQEWCRPWVSDDLGLYFVDDSFVMVFLRKEVVKMEELDIVLEFLGRVKEFADYKTSLQMQMEIHTIWNYRTDVLLKLNSLNAFGTDR